MKIVYSISERGGKNYWTWIGVAFLNSDGSLNVKLEAVPVNGEMQIRDYVPRDEPDTEPPDPEQKLADEFIAGSRRKRSSR